MIFLTGYSCKTSHVVTHLRSFAERREPSSEVKHFLKFLLKIWLNSQNSRLFANNTQYLFANKVMDLILVKLYFYAVFPSFSFSSFWTTYSVNFDTDELHLANIFAPKSQNQVLNIIMFVFNSTYHSPNFFVTRLKRNTHYH